MYESNLSGMRENKKAGAIATTLAAVMFQQASSQNAYAGDAKPSSAQDAVEHRLDKVPQQEPPKMTPKPADINYDELPELPGPFTAFDVPNGAIDVEGSYDAGTQTFKGKVKVGEDDLEIKVSLGFKESDSQYRAVHVKRDNTFFSPTDINEEGVTVYFNPDMQSFVAARQMPKYNLLISGNYKVKEDEKLVEGEARVITSITDVQVVQDMGKGLDQLINQIPYSVRQDNVRGMIVAAKNRGRLVACRFNTSTITTETDAGADATCRQAEEVSADKLSSKQIGEIKRFYQVGWERVKALVGQQATKQDLIAEADAIEKEARRRARVDEVQLTQLHPEYETEIAGPDMGFVIYTIVDNNARIRNYIEQNGLEMAEESPAPKAPKVDDALVVKDAPVVKDASAVKSVSPVKVPGPVNVHGESDAEKPAQKPVGQPLEQKVAVTPTHPALDFTKKVPGKDDVGQNAVEQDDPAFYETWWFWTAVGAVAAGAAAGAGYAIWDATQGGNGPEPQPPVGTPVIGPGDGVGNP